MYCRKCGKEIHDEAVICVHCGCDTMGERTAEDKYCKICGKEITEDDMICMGCGCKLPVNVELEDADVYDKDENVIGNNETGQDKSGIGFVMALFLGLIGLIIGLCLYPSGSFEIKTFLKGWLGTFIALIVIGLMIGIIVAAVVAPRSFRY